MGQYWQLLNIDKREKHWTIGGELGECFWDDHTDLCTMLKDSPLPKSITSALDSGTIALQPGPFGKLPAEIIQHIFTQLTEFHLIVVLSITCKTLLSAGMPALHAAIQREYRTWAGCRLICVGNYATIAGLPPNLLTSHERKELVAYATAWDADGDEAEPGLYSFAEEVYGRFPTEASYADRGQILRDTSFLPSAADRSNSQEDCDELRRIPQDAAEELDIDMIMDLYEPQTASPEENDVLCNFSKGEYVRADRMGFRWKDMSFGDLGHALLSQICWSDDDSVAMPCEGPTRKALIHGPWAGDRFCVVTMETLPRGKEWKDVTERVDAFVSELWKSEYGR